MKVIFLDIDGVLNTAETFDRIKKENLESGTSEIDIDEFRIEYLRRIVEETGAKIVLTSSLRWRFKRVEGKVVPVTDNFAVDFINMLGKYSLSLYDLTPIVRGKEIKRQEEIKKWLSQNEEVDSFVILDDETTELMDFVGTNLVVLNNLVIGEMVRDMRDCTGLCEEHIGEAINILNNRRCKTRSRVKV